MTKAKLEYISWLTATSPRRIREASTMVRDGFPRRDA